ncbi:MAG: Ribonuclease J1 [Eubacteriales bacterium SKADARSKE-1]|nr:Ribonuclease J1 [Eubacteriales bacterium SKADARSKE-1]
MTTETKKEEKNEKDVPNLIKRYDRTRAVNKQTNQLASSKPENIVKHNERNTVNNINNKNRNFAKADNSFKKINNNTTGKPLATPNNKNQKIFKNNQTNQKKGELEPKKVKEPMAKAQHINNRIRKNDKFPSIKIMFLGGLNEIGKNLTLFECGSDMFILDCGLAFPDVEMLGVDLVIPDFSYIEKNIDKIKGLVLTHGHEDHIGSIPYLLRNVNIPIYGTSLTIGLVGGKLKEHNLFNKAKLNVVKSGQSIKLGCMQIEFIHVNHSIPDAVGVAIHSPAGTIVHTGDFKIDFTPTQGGMIDLGKFAELGNKGVLALMADSTNADRPGYTMTEKKLNASFDNLFRQAENKRIIVASFASNIGRIQQIINCATKYGRKVAFSGRSMVNYIAIAGELGYLDVPSGVIIDIDLINRFPKEQIVLLTTGSQGEPMSALSRMATADHRKVEVGPEDFIIISANPIPGNEKMVGSVINDLMKRGCTVVYESMYEVHVSGHACSEELKLIQGLVKPQYFIPVHGEQKHLRRHADLAKEMGLKDSEIFIGDIGDTIELNKDHMKYIGKVPAGRVLVDGLGIGDVGSIVLRDRKHLAQDGLIVVVCTIDFTNGFVVSGPDIVSRGFVYVREAEPLMEAAKTKTAEVLEDCNNKGIHEWGVIKTKIKDTLSKFFYEKTKRSPMILPIIMEV